MQIINICTCLICLNTNTLMNKSYWTNRILICLLSPPVSTHQTLVFSFPRNFGLTDHMSHVIFFHKTHPPAPPPQIKPYSLMSPLAIITHWSAMINKQFESPGCFKFQHKGKRQKPDPTPQNTKEGYTWPPKRLCCGLIYSNT